MADTDTTTATESTTGTLLAKGLENTLYLRNDGEGFVLNGNEITFPKDVGGAAFIGGRLATFGTTVSDVGDGLSLDGTTRKASLKVEDGEKVLKVTANGLSTKLTLKWDKTDTKIKVLGQDDALVSEIDASDFVRDGMLDKVELKTEGGKEYMVFTWNTDSGKQELKVDITKFVDIYTADDGVTLSDNNFSIDWTKVASVSAYLSKADAKAAYASKSLSGKTIDWKTVTLENIYGLVHDMAKEMGATITD